MMNNKFLKIIIIVFMVVVICLLTYVLVMNFYVVKLPVSKTGETVNYTISSGETPQIVADNLESQGLIRNSEYMVKLFTNNNAKMYANTYSISPTMTPDQIFKIISSPTSNIDTDNTLLIYEGEQLEQIATSVSEVLDGYTQKDVLDYWSDPKVLKKLIKQYDILDKSILDENIKYPLEGYLYPATYPVSEEENLPDLTKEILDVSEKEYGKYLDKSNPQNLSFHDSLTLASIVERETMQDSDKYKVSEVFYNRMNQGMPLQSDITVLYAMDSNKENVTYDDTEYDSPYNTYAHKELPPGPIASPSETSLDAVYNPDNNDYLYFFAKQDTGEIIYSETLDEHEAVSEKYAWK